MSWLLAFLGFAALIILHELGHFAAAKAVGMRVERFSLFFPPLLARVRRGETEYAIGAIPLGGYVKITGMNPEEDIPPDVVDRAYYRQPVWKRIVVIAAGPLVNLVIAFLLLWAMLATQPTVEISSKVAEVERGWPAAGVLERGDEIVAVDGVTGGPDAFWLQINTRHSAPGAPPRLCEATDDPVRVTFIRDGQRRTASIPPRYDPPPKGSDGQGQIRLGFRWADGKVIERGPGEAAIDAFGRMGMVSQKTLQILGQLFYDDCARKQVSGVVGSYERTRQVIESKQVTTALSLLALISLSLAIINLLPLLPLDGGHIFWALAEKLRGRPIPLRVMERASMVGFMLVILLFVIGLTNDIGWLRDGSPLDR